MILDQFPAIRALSIDQKVALLSELMGDISSSAPPLSGAHRRVLEERLRDHDAKPDSTLTHQRFLERFEALRVRTKARPAGA